MFFQSLAPLLEEFESLQLKLERGPKGHLRVCVVPPHTKSGGNVSTVPLMLSATPDEFDQNFAQLLQSWSPAYRSLADQAAANSRILAAPKGKAKPANQSPPIQTEDDESDAQSDDSSDVPPPKAVAATASAGTDLLSLLDDSQ